MDRRWVPPTFRHYRMAWLGPDALAGLTLLAVALPSPTATALLAGMSVAMPREVVRCR
jgi:MFS superfamily sulfate permease-like transporter